jgi:hypothetical protein
MGAVGPAAPGDRAIFNASPPPLLQLLTASNHTVVLYSMYSTFLHRFFIVSDTHAPQRSVTKYYKQRKFDNFLTPGLRL